MGQGIDRHLLGLKLQAIEEGLSVPRIFMDTAYGLATHWKLRTGQVTFRCIETNPALIHSQIVTISAQKNAKIQCKHFIYLL